MLFDIDPNFRIATLAPNIDIEYVILLYNDVPILFTGKNTKGERVLASVVCEDDDEPIIRYIHVLLSEEEYLGFVNKSICYRSIIDSKDFVYILDEYNSELKQVYKLSPTQIPNDFLPLQNFFLD